MNSSAVVYDSAAIFIETATTIQGKITKIDIVINALLDVAAKAAANDNIKEYWLDSGQTKIKTVYNGTAQVYAAIEAFEKLKTYYLNKLNGHSFRLMDSRNFKSR